MNDSSVLDALGQVDSSTAGKIFRTWLRGEMRALITDILAEEVTELCGPAYAPSPDSECRRAGGTYVGLRVDGVEECIRKPRVRRYNGDSSSEIQLRSYAAVNRADDRWELPEQSGGSFQRPSPSCCSDFCLLLRVGCRTNSHSLIATSNWLSRAFASGRLIPMRTWSPVNMRWPSWPEASRKSSLIASWSGTCLERS